MNDFLLLLITAFTFSNVNAATKNTQPEIGKYPHQYTSGDYVVTILRLGDESKNTALIKVDGIDNKHDGQIYKHTKKCQNKQCTSYIYETTEIPNKKTWWTINASISYAHTNLNFFPPTIDKKHSLNKSKRPKGFNSQKFYKEYLGQLALRNKK